MTYRVAHARRLCRAALVVVGTVVLGLAQAQVSTEPIDGLRQARPGWHALTDVRLVLAPGQVVEQGTLVVRDGVIVAAGRDVPVPEGARVWRLPGRTVYAGFIDLASPLGVPPALQAAPTASPRRGPGRALEAARAAPATPPAPPGRALASGNPLVRPEQAVADQLEWPAEAVRAARGLGFTSVLATPGEGIFRGQGALLNLVDPAVAPPASAVLQARASQHLAAQTTSGARQTYPASRMGALALIRQTWLDARWWPQAQAATADTPASAQRPQAQASLQALADAAAGRQPVVYAAADEQDVLRAAALQQEFKLRLWVRGTGHEYRIAPALARERLPLIVPLAFPPPPEVESPESAMEVPLHLLQHWEQAPSNPALLLRAGVPFALTAADAGEGGRAFWPNLREAVRRGLPPAQALAALTTQPAQWLGEQARLGTLAPGRLANLVVARGDLFTDAQAQVEWTFVAGQPLATEAGESEDPRGRWQVAAGVPLGAGETWVISGTAQRPRLQPPTGPACELLRQGGPWLLRWPCPAAGAPAAPASETLVFERRGDTLVGWRQAGPQALASGWSARRLDADTQAAKPPAPEARDAPPPVPAPPAAVYPAGAYGVAAPPRPGVLMVRGATVWTQGPAGRLDNADLLVRDGRIAAVGPSLPVPPGAQVIEARGLHLTPGLIDAHSHMAIWGDVNEGTRSVTAEVRIGDVLDATDIDLYRALAGGVTAANLLHGSANTIGGQAQVIKLRWGEMAQGLKFEGAPAGIKFALGENVKQSNWDGGGNGRYPQTRMGVEQVLRDSFAAARADAEARRAWEAGGRRGPPPRPDLQLQALAEILQRQRWIHVHSYRADEILMFARFAREWALPVAAFQHVLEGYKVTEAIRSIDAGASTFTDWWAFKMEVMDAVPANGPLMHRAGIVTGFNSDSAELVRRLNVEAAKAVKYGGLSETEALAFVTLNPARQLGIATRTGSLEVGKDADFVLWSGHPLDSASRAEQTWVDGRLRYSREQDASLRQRDAAERERLVARALPERLAALGGGARGAGRDKAPRSDDAPEDRTPLADLLDWLGLQAQRHQAASRRESYWMGGTWHECTEDAR